MTAEPPPVAEGQAPDVDLRNHISNLQGLLALSMVMTESGDETHILRLATTSIASFGGCRLQGAYVREEGWRLASGACEQEGTRVDIEAQFAVLTGAGGALAITGEAWGWAFPLRSLEGGFGFLVVSSDEQPGGNELFLLRVLAQQTGIALANSRLHTRERGRAEELRSANSALADTVTALEQSTAIHDRFTRVALEASGEQGIAKALFEVTELPVAVEDRHGNLRAWAGPGQPDPYPKDPPPVREELLKRGAGADHPIRQGDRCLVVVNPRADVVGVVALVKADGMASIQEQAALEHAATVLAMELSRLQSLGETEVRLGRDLAEELLTGTDDESALGRARALGYDLQRAHRVAVVDGGSAGGGDSLFNAVRRAARSGGVNSLLVGRGATVVVLSDAERSWTAFDDAVSVERGGADCRVGVGGACARAADYPRSFREAQFALRMQASSGLSGTTMFDELGVYRIFAGVADVGTVERFAREWLGPLLDYDTVKGADLVHTLSEYLECGRNYDATARALGVHRSTLKYRLQRIREISGRDITEADTAFNLHLATRAWKTLLALID
jgi:sugar diacid utilization regulator